MSEQKNKLPIGLYERLVYADELPALQGLMAAGSASISEPSLSLRRELLIHEISARLPELLDDVASPVAGKAEQARSELQFIANLLRRAREDARNAVTGN